MWRRQALPSWLWSGSANWTVQLTASWPTKAFAAIFLTTIYCKIPYFSCLTMICWALTSRVVSDSKVEVPTKPVVIARNHKLEHVQLKLPNFLLSLELDSVMFFLMFIKNDQRSCTSWHKNVPQASPWTQPGTSGFSTEPFALKNQFTSLLLVFHQHHQLCQQQALEQRCFQKTRKLVILKENKCYCSLHRVAVTIRQFREQILNQMNPK